MRGLHLRWALVCVLAAGCGAKTSVLVAVSAPSLNVVSLRLAVTLNGAAKGNWSLPSGGGRPMLPSSAEVLLPDVQATVGLTLTAVDDQGRTIVRTASQTSVPHREVRVDFVLDAGAGDLGAPDDLAGATPPDLVPAPPDLAPPADLAVTPIALAQKGAVGGGNSPLTLTLPVPSAKGTLLVATIAASDDSALTYPSAWLLADRAVSSTVAQVIVLYYPNNPGGVGDLTITSPSTATTIRGQISEWSGAAASPFQRANKATNSAASVFSVTAPSSTSDGALAIGDFVEKTSTSVIVAITTSSDWTALGQASGTIATHYDGNYRDHLAVGDSPKLTDTSDHSGEWAGIVAVFHP